MDFFKNLRVLEGSPKRKSFKGISRAAETLISLNFKA